MKKTENKTAESSVITSVDELRKTHPGLVTELEKQISAELLRDLDAMTGKQINQKFHKVYETVTSYLENKGRLKQDVKGFLLTTDDPFAAGVLRTYEKLEGADGLCLPYVMPFNDRSTRRALENYIVRSSGSDAKRTIAARKALTQCK